MHWVLGEDWVGSNDMWVTVVVAVIILAVYIFLTLVTRR